MPGFRSHNRFSDILRHFRSRKSTWHPSPAHPPSISSGSFSPSWIREVSPPPISSCAIKGVKRCWRVSPIISLRGDPTRTRRPRVEKLYSVQIRRLPLADVRSPTTHCGPLSGQLPRCRACLFLGTKRTCRPRCATSAFRGKAENICSHRAFPVLTHNGPRPR